MNACKNADLHKDERELKHTLTMKSHKSKQLQSHGTNAKSRILLCTNHWDNCVQLVSLTRRPILSWHLHGLGVNDCGEKTSRKEFKVYEGHHLVVTDLG